MDARFPVGPFTPPDSLDAAARTALLHEIRILPAQLREAAQALDARGLNTPYREGGWTARQVVHHVADSHMNAYLRFRLALTEDNPIIKPYDQDGWANLQDSRHEPVETSLQLLESLHRRWVVVMEAMVEADWAKTFRHPELGLRRLDLTLALYAWHGRHHTAHVRLCAH